MKLLLHTCCAPCLIYPLRQLRLDGIDVDSYYYNPNIHPYTEYIRRRDTLTDYARQQSLRVILTDPEEILLPAARAAFEERWLAAETESRCTMCYRERLDRTAACAAENGYDAFSTTLLVSIYQKHDLIREIGEEMSRKHAVPFYYRDFRPGFREGQKEARDLGLYRQKFCGCICSLNESAAVRRSGL